MNTSNKKEKGFSLIELSMVISVIALLLVLLNFAYTSVRDNADVQSLTDFLEFHMLTAVQQCENRRGDLSGCNNETIIALTPAVNRNSSWKKSAWSVKVPESRQDSAKLKKSIMKDIEEGKKLRYELLMEYDLMNFLNRNPSGGPMKTPSPDMDGFRADFIIKLNKIERVRATSCQTAHICIGYAPSFGM